MRLRKDAKIELLKRVPLFSQCSKQELASVAAVADETDLGEGTELTKQGRPGREFVVLIEGEAEVRKNGRKVAALGDGDFFGEIALVTSRPRTATVVAKTPVRVLVITDRAFRSLVERSPSIQGKVLKALAERLASDDL
ncbi:MAG: cyclic nucleotide-binding domain-containing protein [Thermoleophilia bacterium]|nr:cyclic nucleotide-binding domain-containing protein [Thermoleophilia bacterium]